ncbi:MAG: tungsten ABC transporter substrate-binding protein [Dehalococcoidia bacterium]|nr:tungsten ABC transporter substrate-binding protein [Dehalococcoidia bacterium]
MDRRLVGLIVLAAPLLLLGCQRARSGTPPDAAQTVTPPAQPELILLTTTSTQDSGLLDVLLPDFHGRTGYRVKPIAVGSGQALQLGARGEGDVVLAHAPAAEEAWLAANHGLDRRLVMFNDFLIVGPPDDPAGVRGSPSASVALQRVASKRALFISRGDQSGTHTRERQLWRQAGIAPAGNWYQESGTGQGQSMQIASEKGGYMLTDRGTYLVLRNRLALIPLIEHTGPELLNVYHVMTVNPARGARVNAAGGEALADYLVSSSAQMLIRSFGQERFGGTLFLPAAGRALADLRPEGT